MLKKLMHKLFQDQNAEKLIYEMFYKRVYNTAYLMVKDIQLAQDITQETFIQAFKKMDTLNNKEKMGAWLATICTRKAIDFLRKQKRWNDIPTEDVYLDMEISNNMEYLSPVEQMVDQKILKEMLHSQLDQLNPMHKEILLLRYAYDLKEGEIAQALEISVGTVKSRLSRAKVALRNILQTEYEQKEGNG